MRAFCLSPAPEPRYLLAAVLNFQARSSKKVRRAGLWVVNSRSPKIGALTAAGVATFLPTCATRQCPSPSLEDPRVNEEKENSTDEFYSITKLLG